MTQNESATDDLVSEFIQLNRRRLLGAPPLVVAELERWQCLREALEQRLGDRLQGLLASVERRAHFRFPTHLEVRFESCDEGFTARLGNISEGGIFVATERPLAAGAPLRLFIRLPDGTVETQGRVAWARAETSAHGAAGMGVRFEDLTAEQRERIADLVARCTPSHGHA